MIIGIISDTHDRLKQASAVLQYFKDHHIAHVIHAGDWKSVESAVQFQKEARGYGITVTGVLGNNDLDVRAFITLSEESAPRFSLYEGVHRMEIDNKKIAIYHGHHKPTLAKLLAEDSSDVIILGHTHKPLISTINQTLVINPGSIAFSIPRSKSFMPSIAILDTSILHAEIEYLPRVIEG